MFGLGFFIVVSVVAIICQALNILCENEGLTHFEYAYPYIAIIDFISISYVFFSFSIPFFSFPSLFSLS